MKNTSARRAATAGSPTGNLPGCLTLVRSKNEDRTPLKIASALGAANTRGTDADEEQEEHIRKTRRMAIQAKIVRLMKAIKTTPFQELTAKVRSAYNRERSIIVSYKIILRK